ncbi:hypothetical protein CcaverHIS002_0606190 [Cutaneotrichosporon cavernicola]|uniref:Uncharacterized protein n=1 Tax=Cutaneotrichosporon cavernicola TaxID=279322 RepID=A0AA48L929_9TREE|nr:uncharacterized protein CcaverHIS019_0605650 [Cutaneotrichosporon cavernicola]BEI86332.1 hypothetical protein CcaverHIS002_0606190 [Cutaneotrichosporon cavernicola]BEI94106.1 hypothetical protein CcaverHIS019_0605650 [Cutaneotrichosporon cavernicola]BEJ01885.1 hypothetical protein CcaverHIS631_0605670 [Cutaneotrichosporon cavernicola]BEJ09650.1 hypothetical protein CcaverHIS641_0605650 [Cutaneotrichosporon cavernicola]
MAPVPRASPNDSTNPASVAVGVGVGVGVTLLLVLLVAIGFLIWRRHKRAYKRKPGELAAFVPDTTVHRPVPLPLHQHGRRESVQSESERRALLRPSSEVQRLPVWEQRHTFPLSPPLSLPDTPLADAPSPNYRSGTAVVHQPAVEPCVDSAGQVVQSTAEVPAGPRALARYSLPSPSIVQPRPSTAKPPAPASMLSSTNSDKSAAELDAREHFIDLATRPDLLPPSFLPHAIHSEESRYSFTKYASAGPSSPHAHDATEVAGLGRFSSEWREKALMSSSADSEATTTPGVRIDSSGRNPIRMEKVKDDDFFSEDNNRLRLLSFASTTGSRSTGSMSSEGDREMRRQLRQSLQFPIPHPLIAPREVRRHQPNSTRSMLLPPPLSVAVEGLDRRTARRETWAYGDTNDTLQALQGDLGPWHASRNVSKASLASPPATPRPATPPATPRPAPRGEPLPPVTNV